MSAPRSLAGGAELDDVTWADFVERLRHDCRGDGVKRHYTADAIFIVQARAWTYGLDEDFGGEKVACIEDSVFTSPKAFYLEWLNDDGRERLDSRLLESEGSKFLDLSEWSQWDAISDLDDVTVTCRAERWDYVSSHFTRCAAEAFIRRKGHDYREGLRVYVDAQIYCWEFNAIKEAIMDGRLILAQPAEASSS